ncbi:MAG: sigma 54-interacting transcriptional regulator [Eubacteriaceae bacterium]|nr:sigma 54-interacting transcriptional regulator [Eubacteriaceae bacterium]
MSLMQEISTSVQQVAEAISIAVGVEIEIVDNSLTIVGGTGVYSDMVGQKEEAGKLDGSFLYARVLRSGVTQYIEDAPSDKYYGEQKGNITAAGELAEICTPIKCKGEIIGIIGLVAFSEEQRAVLLDKDRSMVSFVEKMADLLAAKAAQQENLLAAEIARREMFTVLETAHEGMVAIDKSGLIRHCNSRAAELFKTARTDIIDEHLNKYMIGSPALDVLKTGKGYTEKEELYRTEKGSLHIIATAKPFFAGNDIEGVVLSFRDIQEAQKLAYKMTTKKVKNTFDDIIGNSEAINRAKEQAMITSRSDSTVLITGESGTGKEMFAKAIHYSGPRAGNPFVTVNCGAIPENLLESELFGYEKGAFTGASEKGKKGKFEAADGGTIFLDEIGDMPMHLQVKILHVLQNMRFERVGGNSDIMVDVRVIAATNKNLEEMIKEDKFREDLYYRLSVIPIDIPPLRERREDIQLFMEYFLKKYNSYMERKLSGFDGEVYDLYVSYDWPGNVRELENAVEYSTNMAQGEVIGIKDVPQRINLGEDQDLGVTESSLPLADQIKEYERAVIIKKLRQHGESGNSKDLVAKELGLSRATLYRKLSELEINKKLL